MPKAAAMELHIDPDLRAEFAAAAKAAHRDTDELIAEFMQDYVAQQSESDAAYGEFVHRKVEKARESLRQGLGRSNDEVEATFSALRRKLQDRSA